MRDPFKTNTNKQLVREAQFGFTVIGLLVATLIYVAWFRLSGIHDMTPAHIRDAPVATQVFPNSPNYDRETNQMVTQNSASPVTNSHFKHGMPQAALVEVPREMMLDSQRTARSLSDMAVSVDKSVNKVASMIRTPTKNMNPAKPISEKPVIITASTGSGDSGFKVTRPPARVASGITFLKPLPKTNPAKAKTAKAKTVEPPALPKVAPTSHDGANDFKPLVKEIGTFPNSMPRQIVPEPMEPKVLAEPKIEKPVSVKPAVAIPAISAPKISAPFTLDAIKPKADKSPEQPAVIKATDQTFVPSRPKFPQQPLPSLRPTVAEKEDVQPKSEVAKLEVASSGFVKTVSFETATWEVKKGDSFWSIAQSNYGDGRFFRALYEQNRRAVPGFEDLTEGTELSIPSQADLIRRYPMLCPSDAVHKDDPWRATPDHLMKDLTDECESDLDQRLYETKAKDTLFEVARRQLGQASRYVELIELNRFQIDKDATHETQLPAGIQLIIPEN